MCIRDRTKSAHPTFCLLFKVKQRFLPQVVRTAIHYLAVSTLCWSGFMSIRFVALQSTINKLSLQYCYNLLMFVISKFSYSAVRLYFINSRISEKLIIVHSWLLALNVYSVVVKRLVTLNNKVYFACKFCVHEYSVSADGSQEFKYGMSTVNKCYMLICET